MKINEILKVIKPRVIHGNPGGQLSGATSHRRKYLTDMQNAIRYAIEVAYEMAIHIAIGYLRQLH
ncbi:MAG: hypothetical protein QXH66_02240 [Conexivisphaerales archaeon]